jgi:predicted MPP superfamily phosphohydrolase
MKTIVLGDTHGRSNWKLAVHQDNPDRVIFIGDYFDSFNIKGEEQLNNFLDIIEYKKTSGKEVIMLIGNHDHHYFPEVGDTGTSGYQAMFSYQIRPVLDANREHLQMAYQFDDFLFSHAGVSSKFMDSVFGTNGWKTETIVDDLNELFKYKPLTFSFGSATNISYLDPYGDNEEQSPIWIRPRSLKSANRNTLRKEIIQIAGHTAQNQIDIHGKTNGLRYFFIDTLETSGEYLIINDNVITTGKVR